MKDRRINRLVPIGLLCLSGSIIVQRFMHNIQSDFVGGLLMGVSLGLILFGFLKQRRIQLK